MSNDIYNPSMSRRSFLDISSKLVTAAVVAPGLLKGQGQQVPKGWPKGRPYWDIPADQLEILNSRNLKKTLDDAVVNPFHQPNLIHGQFDCYGGGDHDNDGISQSDIDAAAAGTNRYELEVNGDGIVNVTDANLIQSYKDGDIGALPGYWNFLQNKQERESWLTKMLAVDKTDEKEWTNPSFISRDFAGLLHTNMFGSVKESSGDSDLPPTWIPPTNGLFNFPLYYASVFNNTFGHGMNAVLTGDNPLEFADWCGVEPQTDEINIKPGTWNIPYNSTLRIAKITKHLGYIQGIYQFTSEPVISFNIDGSGNATYSDPHPNLLTSRPTVGIEDEKNTNLSEKYSLEKIYPNPSNAGVNISYNLPERNNISIDVFNGLGKKVNSFKPGMQEQGPHKFKWNANQPSGTYFIRLMDENKILAKGKVAILK